MPLDDFELVLKVHLPGSVYCHPAPRGPYGGEGLRPHRDDHLGRAGFSGNFGQSNYGAAKMGLVGLMNTLKLEGERKKSG